MEIKKKECHNSISLKNDDLILKVYRCAVTLSKIFRDFVGV